MQVDPPQALEDSMPLLARFDSDSKQITVDTGATLSLSHDRHDFVGEMTPLTRNVRGVSGNVNATHTRTVDWQIEDDNGQVHDIHISNVMYIPTASSRLLSLQHWAQESNDLTGTGCDTNGKRVKLYWNSGQYVKTIPLNPGTTVGSMMTAPGVQMFHAYAAQYQFHPLELSCFPVHVIPDDEELLQPPDPIAPPQEDNISPVQETIQSPEEFYSTPSTTTKDTENIVDWSLPNLIEEDESEPPVEMTPYAKLMRWHYRLGHAPFPKLKNMVFRGELPKRLLNVQNPFCAACQYGKLTKQAWRTKGKQSNTFESTYAGQIVSIDQMESPTAGFVVQLKGKLTLQ